MRRERGKLWKRGTEDKSGEAAGPDRVEKCLKGKGHPEEMRGKEDEESSGRVSALATFLIAETKCLTKTAERRRRKFILVHSLREHSPSRWGRHGCQRRRPLLVLQPQPGECWCSVQFLLFIQLRTHGVVLSTPRLDHPSSISPI